MSQTNSTILSLQAQFEAYQTQKMQWQLQKSQFKRKIASLEAQISAGEVINLDLLKRVKILEYSLAEERKNKQSLTLNMEANVNTVFQQLDKKRVEKNDEHILFLQKILAESGISKKDLDKKQYAETKQYLNQPMHQLYAHLDEVRGVFYQQKANKLVSISEDCLIKVWNVGTFNAKTNPSQNHFTVRQNTGQLLTITGTTVLDTYSIVFTGGIQGAIKAWDISGNQTTLVGQWMNFPVQQISQSQEVVLWDLAYLNNHLLSSSSNSQIRLYSLLYKSKKSQIMNVNSEFVQSFKQNKQYHPTSISWINKKSFVNGFVNVNKMSIWDIQHKKVISSCKYSLSSKNIQPNAQCNKVTYNSTLKQIVSAHEDNVIRCFDINSNKLTKTMIHENSVSCLQIPSQQQWEIFSGCYDGCIYRWDTRMNRIINKISEAHLNKFDESVLALTLIEDKQLLVSGGADSLIKVFQY